MYFFENSSTLKWNLKLFSGELHQTSFRGGLTFFWMFHNSPRNKDAAARATPVSDAIFCLWRKAQIGFLEKKMLANLLKDGLKRVWMESKMEIETDS